MPIGCKVYGAADGADCNDEARYQAQITSFGISFDDRFFQIDTMIHLFFGHFQNSVCGSRDDLFISLKDLGRRQGARPFCPDSCEFSLTWSIVRLLLYRQICGFQTLVVLLTH